MIKLPEVLENILNKLQTIGVKPIVVGGSVRDSLLGIECKDFDIEIFSANNIQLVEEILKEFGKVKQIGKSFGVLILSVDSFDFDFAFPRSEKKIGNTHQSFEIITNPHFTYAQAAFRRDFTINSIGYDFKRKKLLDPYFGIEDLKKKKIRHINDETFVEDSLRVYRAIQFASRLSFSIDKETFLLCKEIVAKNELSFLAKERVYEEFKKIFLKSRKPSVAFELLKDLGIIKKHFHELFLEELSWTRTMKSIDKLSRIIYSKKVKDEKTKLIFFYAVLCHTLKIEDVKTFLSKLTNENEILNKIVNLIESYSLFLPFLKTSFLEKDIKRLSLIVKIEDLCFIYFATHFKKDDYYKSINYLLNKAKELKIHNTKIKPLVEGKDLIRLGFKPSKEFKIILDYALDLQIEKNLLKEEILNDIVTFNNVLRI